MGDFILHPPILPLSLTTFAQLWPQMFQTGLWAFKCNSSLSLQWRVLESSRRLLLSGFFLMVIVIVQWFKASAKTWVQFLKNSKNFCELSVPNFNDIWWICYKIEGGFTFLASGAVNKLEFDELSCGKRSKILCIGLLGLKIIGLILSWTWVSICRSLKYSG